MAIYEINGGVPLKGTVTVSGAKNAAVAILPAALLVKGRCRIENVPDISDVRILLAMLRGLGAVVETPEPGVVIIDAIKETLHKAYDAADEAADGRAKAHMAYLVDVYDNFEYLAWGYSQ